MITIIQCPHCARRAHVYHLAWTALICMGCGKEVNKADWRIIEKAREQPTRHAHIKRLVEVGV